MAMQAISVSIEIEIPQLDDSVCPVRQAQIFQQPCDCPNVNGDGRRKLDGLNPDINAHNEPLSGPVIKGATIASSGRSQ